MKTKSKTFKIMEKTFEQCKDEVAKKSGWGSITDLFINESLNTSISALEEAAELYANSKAAKAWEESKEVNSIQFATWYSGMRKEQVELQYKRYLRQFNHQPTNPYE